MSSPWSLQSHTDTSNVLIMCPTEWCCLWERNIDSSQRTGEAQENLDQDAKVNELIFLDYGKQ